MVSWSQVKGLYARYCATERYYKHALRRLNKVKSRIEKREDWIIDVAEYLETAKTKYEEFKILKQSLKDTEGRSERQIEKSMERKKEAIVKYLTLAKTRIRKLHEDKPRQKLIKRVQNFEKALGAALKSE